jgi:hypothetical protein
MRARLPSTRKRGRVEAGWTEDSSPGYAPRMHRPSTFASLVFLPFALACGGGGGGAGGAGGAGGSGGEGNLDAGVDAPDPPVTPVSCWPKEIGPWSAIPNDMALHGSGDVIVGGSFFGQVDFGGVLLDATAADGTKAKGAFVARLRASDGTTVWARSIGAPEEAGVSSLAVDPDGSVVVGGYMTAALADLGGVAPVDPAGGAFLARLDGATGAAKPNVIALDVDGAPTLLERASDGSYVAAGDYIDYARIDDVPLPQTSSRDIWVARVSLDGGDPVRWSTRLGDGGSDGPRALALTANDDVAVAAVVRPTGEVVFGGLITLLGGADGVVDWSHTYTTGSENVQKFKDLETWAIGVTATEVVVVGTTEASVPVGGDPLPIAPNTDAVWQGSYALADGAHQRSQTLYDDASDSSTFTGGVTSSGELWFLTISDLRLYTPMTSTNKATYPGGSQPAGKYDPANSRWYVTGQGAVGCWQLP